MATGQGFSVRGAFGLEARWPFYLESALARIDEWVVRGQLVSRQVGSIVLQSHLPDGFERAALVPMTPRGSGVARSRAVTPLPCYSGSNTQRARPERIPQALKRRLSACRLERLNSNLLRQKLFRYITYSTIGRARYGAAIQVFAGASENNSKIDK
jgi:hypothetical protein